MRDERETERKRERGEVFPIFRMLSVRAPRLAFLASPLLPQKFRAVLGYTEAGFGSEAESAEWLFGSRLYYPLVATNVSPRSPTAHSEAAWMWDVRGLCSFHSRGMRTP